LTATDLSSLPRSAFPAFADFNGWFTSVVDETKPSLIVGIARAAIRMLQIYGPFVESVAVPTVSHHALPFLPDSAIEQSTTLLFDDSVVFGSTMKSVRDYLLSRGACVSCASYVVDRETFYGDLPPASRTLAAASPHSIIPLRYAHLLWPAAIRRHHDALVRAILGSPNHYNFDFPTFRFTLNPDSTHEPVLLAAALAELPGARGVFEISSVASTQNDIYRYTVLLEPERQDLFADDSVSYRGYLKLRALFAPSLGEVRLTPIPQLTISDAAQFAEVRFRDERLNALWHTLRSPRDGDPWYSQALLRLLGIFVGICLGAPLARLFASSLLGREPEGRLTLLEDELRFMTGEDNCARLEAALSTLGVVGSDLLSVGPGDHHPSPVSEAEDSDLTAKILQVWDSNPHLRPDGSEPLYSAASRVLLSLREATDTPALRRLTPDMSRLEVGLTFRDIHNLLTLCGLQATPDETALAIDLCVDNGQAVPKVVRRDSRWLRVFYSGEAYNSQDLLQLELAIGRAYATLAQKSSRQLSPFDFHKLCVFMKDILPWLPISSRYYTFGKQALIGQDREEIVQFLTARDGAPLCRSSETGGEVLIPNPDFRPAVKPAWEPDRSRDFYDAFEYIGKAFTKLPDEVKLLVSTCRTHRETYNAVAFEAHSWVFHKNGDFQHFLAAVEPQSYGAQPNVSPPALKELYWSIQYLIEADKKWMVFHRTFAAHEERAAQAFRAQGASAERFWRYKVEAQGLLNPSTDKEIEHRFAFLVPVLDLMKLVTTYTVRVLEESDALSQRTLRAVFAERHAPLRKGDYPWLTKGGLMECALRYNELAEAATTPGKTFLRMRLPIELRTHESDWFRSVHKSIQSATEEISAVLNEYCPRYEVREGDLPYSPDATTRRRADGTTEVLLKDVYVLTMDIIGSTDDERTGEFKQRILDLLSRSIKGRGHFERTGNDAFVVCSENPEILWEIAQIAKVEGEAAAKSAKTLRGTRKGLSFGTVQLLQDPDGTSIIRDAQVPHLLPRAFGLLSGVDQYKDDGELVRNSFVALEEPTIGRCGQQLRIKESDGIPVEVKAKHFLGKCLLFRLDGD